MRTPRAVNSLIDDLLERKYRKVGQEKKNIRIFSRRVLCFNIVTPGTGSKYREFYDLWGRITCMDVIKGLLHTLSLVAIFTEARKLTKLETIFTDISAITFIKNLELGF